MHIQDFIEKFKGQLPANNNAIGKSKISSNSITSESALGNTGDVFEGTIKEIKGNKVTIMLPDGKTIDARLEADINLSEGNSFFFQVKSNDGNTIEIVPYKNSEIDNPIIQNAIKDAGLLLNDKSIELVNSLMEEGLSIGSENLSRFGRILAKYPNIDVTTLIKMDEFHLDITPENIDNFIRFKEQNNTILNDGKEFLNNISKELEKMNINKDDAVNIMKNMIESITENDIAFGNEENIFSETENRTLSETENVTISEAENGKKSAINENESDIEIFGEKADKSSNNAVSEENAIEEVSESVKNVVKEKAVDDITSSLTYKAEDSVKNINWQENENIISGLKIKDTNELNSENSVFNLRDEILKDINNPEIKDELYTFFNKDGNLKSNISEKDILNILNELLKNDSSVGKNDFLKLYSNKGVEKLLNDLLSKSWSILPKEVSEKDAIKKLYDNINKSLDNIISKMEDTIGNKNPINEMANNIKNSIEFMNQMNNMYSYVQLPLRMMKESATGDLYVYSDKRKPKSKNDEFSAFLHLSLKHLGNTDISIKMQRKNVNIDFSVESKEIYDLLNQNIHMLDERLIKKGYIPNTKVTTEAKSENFVEKLLGEEKNKKESKIKRYSFDVRA